MDKLTPTSIEELYESMTSYPDEVIQILNKGIDIGIFIKIFQELVESQSSNFLLEYGKQAKGIAAAKLWQDIFEGSGTTNLKSPICLVAFLVSDALEKSRKRGNFSSIPIETPLFMTHSVAPNLIRACVKENPVTFGQIITAAVMNIQTFLELHPDIKDMEFNAGEYYKEMVARNFLS